MIQIHHCSLSNILQPVLTAISNQHLADQIIQTQQKYPLDLLVISVELRGHCLAPCVKESAVVLFCSRALMPTFCWLMASHEPAPVLLPSLWEGGWKGKSDGASGRKEVQKPRESERGGEKTEVRLGRGLAG